MKTTMLKRSAIAVALASIAFGTAASTDTETFDVTITLEAACEITSATDLEFGTHPAIITANIDATSTVNVLCSNGTVFDLELNDGLNASGGTRRMSSAGGSFVNYELFSDSGRTAAWAEDPDEVSSTGTGAAQAFTVYGRVPVQTPDINEPLAFGSPITLDDTVTVTLSF